MDPNRMNIGTYVLKFENCLTWQYVYTDSDSDFQESEMLNVNEKKEEHSAAERGNVENVRRLLLSSANINVPDIKNNTPLHYAARKGRTDVVDLLLNKNASVNSRNLGGRTPLHLASEHGHFTIAQMLLKNNADVHVTDRSNNTPIDIARMFGHFGLVQLLNTSMKYQPLMSTIEHSRKETKLLHSAAKCGNAIDVQQLLLNCDANPNATNSYGDTPLHLACENNHLEVVEVLLRNNADANVRNASDKTSLHIAADLDYAEIVKSLIEHKGEINGIDRNGDTALHLAASDGHNSVVNVLLKHTAELNEQVRSQLATDQVSANEFEPSQHCIRNTADAGQISDQIVAECGNVQIANIQLNRTPIANAVFRGQSTPLHLSTEHGHAEMLENLTSDRANVNACNNDKMTPLHLACENGQTSIAKILLDSHATVDVTAQSDKTPFFLAAKNGHADVTDLLLRHGVCDFVLNEDKETPLHIAVEEGHTKVAEVIMKHSFGISEKLSTDRHRLQESAKNSVETRGVIPVELLKNDDRRVTAEIVWREENSPIETRRDAEDRIALSRAASLFKPEMVRVLLNAGQCVYSKEDLRQSFESVIDAIEREVFFKKCQSDFKQYRMDLIEIAKVLINSSKFNVNQQNNIQNKYNTLLHELMQRCRCSSDAFPELLEIEHMSIPIRSKWRRLQVQIRNDLLQLLLEKRANFNLKNYYGETPLIIAARNGCFHSIQILFDWEQKSEEKLDLDARDRFGATALIRAAEINHVSVVGMLINHKASVNLQNYYGLTALHSSIYEPNYNWFDLDFFCKSIRMRNFQSDVDFEISSIQSFRWRDRIVHHPHAIGQIQKFLEYDQESTQFKEQVVKLLLCDDKTNVDIQDFGGNAPLDLAMKFSKRFTSATIEALRNRGTIRNKAMIEDEPPIDVGMVDERGRNPLHRLIIDLYSQDARKGDELLEREHEENRLDVMCYGILLRPENFLESAAAKDDKGRTPLHYAAMLSTGSHSLTEYLLAVLLKLGVNVNAADIYNKTPLHYTDMRYQYDPLVKKGPYELLVQNGADENAEDKIGFRPKGLKLVTEKEGKLGLSNTMMELLCTLSHANLDINQVRLFKTNHVAELSKQTAVETVRIYSQSPRPEERAEKTIFKVWTENKCIRLNRRQNKLKPPVQHFVKRLADGIKKKDERFECQPILVGSAEEETKTTMSADFDFNFKLIKFSQICYPFPHPLGPKGYFELRRKPNKDADSKNDVPFACFFNSDQCLLTNEVNSRFQIMLEEVLYGHHFWQGEHLFELNVEYIKGNRRGKPAGLCKTLRLIMINPIDDGENGLLFVNISIDIAACVHVENYWPEDSLPVGINPDVKETGCSYVFDQPRFDSSKKQDKPIDFIFSDTFARISFATLESRMIKESPAVAKAAYIVCKECLPTCTYQLKTCLLFCMEALNIRNGSGTSKNDKVSPKRLAFWVERILFCLTEFNQHDVFPCYFMPSFKHQFEHMNDQNFLECNYAKDITEIRNIISLQFSKVYNIYLDLCPNDTAIDIPIVRREVDGERFYANYDPYWEEFDREEFIRKLSSRRPNSN